MSDEKLNVFQVNTEATCDKVKTGDKLYLKWDEIVRL